MMVFGVKIDPDIRRDPGKTLIVASALVSATRWADAWAAASGFKIDFPLWNFAHAMSGLALAVIEPVAVVYCTRALTKPGSRWIKVSLATMIVASIFCLFVIGQPIVVSSSQGLKLTELISDQQLWNWGGAVTLANLLLLASVALADHLHGAVAPTVVERTPDITVKPVPTVNTVDTPVKDAPALPQPEVLAWNPETVAQVWNETPEGERSYRKVAERFGKSHAQFAKLLARAKDQGLVA